jgi:hypothetical protein
VLSTKSPSSGELSPVNIWSTLSPDLTEKECCSKKPGTLLDGYAAEEIGDFSSKLKDDVAFPQECAERISLGFELVHLGPQKARATKAEKVA